MKVSITSHLISIILVITNVLILVASTSVTEQSIEGVTEEASEQPIEGVTEEASEQPIEGVTEEASEQPIEGVTEEASEQPIEGATEQIIEGSTTKTTKTEEETTKNLTCEIRFDPESTNKFKMAFIKCSKKTGFPGNYTSKNVTYIEMLESNKLKDKCFTKCYFEELKLINSKGKVEKDMFSSIFKTNAPEKMEKERIKGWKNCAKNFEKDMKEKKGAKGKHAKNVNRSCLHATKLFVCGTKSDEKLLTKCQKKHSKV